MVVMSSPSFGMIGSFLVQERKSGEKSKLSAMYL